MPRAPKDSSIYYNPKEFRRSQSNGGWQGVNKRVRNNTNTQRRPATLNLYSACALCLVAMIVTFTATMLILALDPSYLNKPYLIAMKIVKAIA